MSKKVIAYIHTHWDREWYREYEIFRMRLLRVFDRVLHLLDNNRIPCFYFDGQVAALEDYLEMRPEKLNLIKSLIFSKKLFIGPFYCLVDEFLTDKTCFAKNLELGMSKAIELGCTDFIGYLADTFGHSANVVDVMMDFGIDKAMVWRGCGDFPAEFKWCGMDTVNLVRGYFQDIFAQNITVEEKAQFIKKELDKIAEKSGEVLLMPIGADHLGVPEDLQDQILSVNELLRDDYEIILGSPFDYFKAVEGRFSQFKFNKELRDNSKTFTLQGCYSSRLDLKRYNTECSHKLDLASRYIRFTNLEEKYDKVLEHAYKMLLQNQAHDSICGCSTDDVHFENITRYKKILQIADTIIDEIKFITGFHEKSILNLDNKPYTGIIEINSVNEMPEFEKVASHKGFDKNLLTDTLRIPVTEDYTNISTYITRVSNLKQDSLQFVMPELEPTDLSVTDTSLENSYIKLKISGGDLYINYIPVSIIDFIDLGDSYNNAPKPDDNGKLFTIIRSKILYKGEKRASLKIDFEGKLDFITLVATLDKNSNYIKFNLSWDNSQKNHLLEVKFELPNPIKTVFSEDMNTLIKRKFKPDYNIRENLPKERGIEVKTNTAPMQRGLLIDEKENNIGIITKGLTQYEVFKNCLYLPILRATGVISNPINPARTTPAGPPIETPALQMIGENKAEFCVFFGNDKDFENTLSAIYNYIIT